MSCSGEKGKYLSYKCYSRLEKFFEGANLSDDGQAAFDSTIEKIKGSPYINSMDKFIRDIAKFLTSDTAFSFTGYDVSCMYMNFWLNKQVKNSYNDEYKSIFIFFDDFASKFAKERENKNSKGYSCKNHIKELVGDEYHKKQILYELYDYYTEHKTPKNYRTIEQLCANLNLIIGVSRGAKKYIDDDKDFAKLLRELKDLIQKDKYHKEKCHYSMLKNMLPEEDSKPKVEVPVMPVDKPTLPIPPNENVEHVEGDISGQVQTVLSGTVELPKESNLQEEVPLKAMKQSEYPQEEVSHTVLQETNPFYNTISQGDRLLTTLSQPVEFLEHERELRQTRYHLLGDTQQVRSDAGGVLGSIQHTLTDVLGSVEPAPILGVSGGMGALFLLFKYTPVGTFFRGRRGRTYGIPSGFNIPFQGGLQGYEDYYSGNLGSDRFHVSYQAE
ncbi:PIR protein [Plasmodium vivax]|uniref:VIR protein n=1 Tax=Plasmodium vivax TaxID=5855 RepID=A0A565A511_PLAVI|nr:PIR protein [Plasmodium vivax]